jgi:kynurenine formamidase
MCSPMVIAKVTAQMGPADRAAGAAARPPQDPEPSPSRRCFTHVVDLTHPLPTDFPSASGEIWLELEEFRSYASHGINFKRWLVHEHLGTHIDAPIHFSESGATAEQIPVEQLVVPLAIVDIRGRAEEDPDTELTPEDLRLWESRHGELPQGCCVAVNAGWDRHATGAHYRNADEAGTRHFPGVHVDAAQMLLEERHVVGLAVDTLSIDHGLATAFPTHRKWLPAGRWAVEGLANLAKLPATGATIVVGGPTIVGATGGPSRIFGLV